MPMSMRSVTVFAFSLVLALAAGTARGAVSARVDPELAALTSPVGPLPARADSPSVRLVEEDVDDEGDDDNDDDGGQRSQLLLPRAAVPSSATLLADDDGDDDGDDSDEDEDQRVVAPSPVSA